MVDGVALGFPVTEVVPTADLVGTAVVVLAYTGVWVGAQVLQYTTLVVVTGLITVHGQLVMVKVVDSVAVYVTPLKVNSVETGQTVVYAVCTSVV
jgi:hypothetical protein